MGALPNNALQRTADVEHGVALAPGAKSAEETLSIFRRVRDEIREWMKDFISGRAALNDEMLSA